MSSGSSASYHCEKKGAARLDEEKTSSRRHGEPKSASPYPTASTKRRLDSEDVGQQPGPSSLRTPEHDEDEEMPEDELLETRIVPIVSKRSTRSQKLREDVASERTKSPSTPHQVAQNLIDKYKNNRKIGHVKKGERCSICLRCSGIHCGKMHSNVQKKVESDLQRLLPDGEEIEVIFIEKVLRYLKGRYQYEEGNLKDVYIRHMIIEGHKLNLYNSQEKERKFEEEEARFEKTIVPASLLKALKKVMEKIKGDRNPLEDCIARKVSFCMYCNREKEPTCNDGHRLTLGQFAINEVERNHNGDWRSVENVIAKLKDQELIYMSNLVEFRNSLKRESERRPKQHHEEQRQSPSAPTTSHQARQQSPLVFDEDEHDLERGFEESSTSSRRAETSQSYDPHQDHREDTVQAEEYEFDEDEYGFGTGLREPSNGSGIRRLVVDDIIDNDQDTLAPSTTTTSNPQPELPNHSQQLSIPQHQQPSQYQQPSCPVQDPSHRSLSPDVFSPAIQSPQKSKIPEESVNVEVEEDLKMEVDEDEDPEDGPPSNLAEYTQLGSSEGSLKIDEDDPPVTEKRVKGAPASRDEKMELEEEPIGVITDEQCTTDFRYLLEEQFHERKLEFLPDFEAKNFNTSKDYRYCEIPGLPPADSQRPYRDNHHLLNQIQWRPFHPYMSNLDRNPDSYRPKPEEIPNRMYRTDKNTLEQWLKEHRYSAEGHSGGFQMFSHVLHELGRICNGYNSFAGLLKYFNTVSREKNSEKYVLDQFANVVRIALKAEEALPKRIYRLTGSVESATFSHVQCAALLARMFFKPIRSSLSFHYLLEHDDDLSIEKLRFLFAYFDRIATNPPDGCVSFRLKTLRKDEFKEEWIKNKYNPMPDVRIYDEMVIEETALCTQVDFANEYLGGGVLASGAVQEEIRFLMCPEMIVGMLLTDKMNDDQAISIVGAYVYSGYTGYARDLKWHPLTPRYARQNDTRLRDKYGRLRVETTAIDATYFKTKGLADQVAGGCMSREMKKAFTGFSAQSEQFDQIPIVSGFWGCGAFNGHKPLKFLQQVIIAGMVKRPLVFCTFQEAQTKKYFEAVMERLRSENISIGVLNLILREIAASQPRLPYNPTETFVFDFVFQFLADPQNRELLHSLKPLKSTS